jgi:hypothetical protein
VRDRLSPLLLALCLSLTRKREEPSMPQERESARVTIVFFYDRWTSPQVGWDAFSTSTPATPVLLRHSARELDEAASKLEAADIVEIPLESRDDDSTS